MIERTFDAGKVNEIVNHPEVYPWLCGAHKGPLDLSIILADRRFTALFGQHGGVIFEQHQPGYYEAHTQVVPAGRGVWTLAMVNEALHYMFTKTDAVEIVTKVPRGNLGARALAKAIHGRKQFTNPTGWFKDGERIPADIFSLSIQDWIATAPGLPDRGHWFHERLQAEYSKLGVEEEIHADDETHDRYVGAAVEMILGGQPQKGVVFYNRWSVMAGYSPVFIETFEPLTVDISDAVLFIRNNDFWVIECRLAQRLAR